MRCLSVSRMFRRPGLSLLELLVVLAVVGVLFALLLPAIQAAREAARRASCASKLRQIGIALHAYSDKHGCYPFSSLSWTTGGPWDTLVFLLPYVEQRELYNALNLSLPAQGKANSTITFRSPGAYLCPSDGKPNVNGYGFANYQKSHGSGLFPGGLDADAKPASPNDEFEMDGFFGKPPISERDVIDGLSNTSAMCEMVHGAELILRGTGSSALGITFDFHVSPTTQRRVIAACERIRSSSTVSEKPSGQRWFGLLGYTHLFTPGMPSCFDGGIGNVFSPLTASSRHSAGGVNLLLCDGHVRFVSRDIDSKLWQAIGSRNGREPIDGQF